MFWRSLRPLLEGNREALTELDAIHEGFAAVMQQELEAMWARKLGLAIYDEELVSTLLQLLMASRADYTRSFRLLSAIPEQASDLHPSFYVPSSSELDQQWESWLRQWRTQLHANSTLEATSAAMRRVNPAVTWREWLIAPAYQQAEQGDHSLIQELQEVFSTPYDDLSEDRAARYDRLRPRDLFNTGGLSHYSCSS